MLFSALKIDEREIIMSFMRGEKPAPIKLETVEDHVNALYSYLLNSITEDSIGISISYGNSENRLRNIEIALKETNGKDIIEQLKLHVEKERNANGIDQSSSELLLREVDQVLQKHTTRMKL